MPCYLKSHSQGEYVFDHGWANAFERAGGRYYPKLQVSVPFTPASGPRLLARADAPTGTRETLIAGLHALAVQGGASSVHATFLLDNEAEAFDEAGWLARTDQQFHWHNRGYRDFDDFLEAFASRKRKQVKRERREADRVRHRNPLAHRQGYHRGGLGCFLHILHGYRRPQMGRPYLNRTFFSLLGERMSSAVLLIFAYRDGRPIAGALNMIGSDTLYGPLLGLHRRVSVSAF